MQHIASYKSSFLGGTWTLTGYLRSSGELLPSVCDGDTSTNCSAGLMGTVGGISFTGALETTAGNTPGSIKTDRY